MKKNFSYHGKTGIARTNAFKEKMLAEYSVNIGNICEFGCTFCYVPAVTNKQQSVIEIKKQGFQPGEFSLYRTKENVIETVQRDLEKIPRNSQETVFFCTTCDPCATPEHASISIDAIRLIMEKSNLQARVLSKSVLIKTIAMALSDYKKRIVYSLSTGTSLDKISKAIEEYASPIKARIEALYWLQDNGYRTYGMICPVIPSEVGRVKELIDQIRPELCEHVWVEAVNVRGKSMVNTYEKLLKAGLKEHADELKRVMGNKKNWLEYSKALFLAFQSEMKQRGQLDKLRFLQYVSNDDREFFEGQKGAVCL